MSKAPGSAGALTWAGRTTWPGTAWLLARAAWEVKARAAASLGRVRVSAPCRLLSVWVSR